MTLTAIGDMQMLIYYLSNSQIPSTLANSIQIMKMCSAFAECGHDVTLFATHVPDVTDDVFAYYGVPETFSIRFDYPEPKRKKGMYLRSRYRWSLTAEFEQRPPDLFYGRDVGRLLAVAHLGRPVVCEVHRLPRKSGRFRRLVKHRALRRIVCITEALQEDLIASYPRLSRERVVVFPDGADPPPEGLRPAALRQSRPGQVNVCYTGNLYPGKGMEIISQLPQNCAWADFHVVGGSDEEVRCWHGKLSSLPNVFFYGRQEPRAVAGYIKAADIALAPYQRRVEAYGGADITRWMSPLKIFEYMALAKPIIASDVPVLREVLSHGETAILVPPDDTTAWTDVLLALSREPDRRRALGTRAYVAFKDRFTWVGRSRSILDACSAPLDGRKKPWAELLRTLASGKRAIYGRCD